MREYTLFSEFSLEDFKVGKVANRDIVADRDVEYIDENAFGSYYMTSSPAHINSLAVLPPTIREVGNSAFHSIIIGYPL